MGNNIFEDLAEQNAPITPTSEPAPTESVDVNGQYTPEPEQPIEVAPSKPTPQQSFQEMRLKNEQLQRERDDALRILRQVEEYANQQQQQMNAPKQEEVYKSDYDDDDIVEGRHLKNEIGAIKKEFSNYKQKHEQFLAQQQQQFIESQLKSKYADFDKVVTYENCVKLRELKPEIASTLNQSTDVYNKASATYTLLKELGIYQEDTINPDIQKAQQNSLKPKGIASVSPQRGDSPLSHANAFAGELSESDRRKIYANMVANAKRR